MQKTSDMFKWKKTNGKDDEEKQFEAFEKSIANAFKNNDELQKMENIDLAYFRVIAQHHFYLVVFNLKKGGSVIIDNSRSQQSYDIKYKTFCDLLWSFCNDAHEHYNGETEKSCIMDFPTEEEGQALEMKKMGIRLATKIMTHDINTQRQQMSDKAYAFAKKHTDTKMKRDIINVAISKRKKEDSDSVASAI
ncbi:hypothetical protein Tco_0610820 [Tanacetum coccineum]